MSNLKVGESGAKFCHFPKDEAAGYDVEYFNGLLSEHLVLTNTKRGTRWAWEKLPGHQRNEPLDCRNYANAGLRIINPDMDALERRLKGAELPPKEAAQTQQQRRRTKKVRTQHNDDW
jgi:phage terminase large subunit GpA-like protein